MIRAGDADATASNLGKLRNRSGNYPGSEWYQDSYDNLVKVGEATPVDRAPGAEQPGLLRRLWRSVF